MLRNSNAKLNPIVGRLLLVVFVQSPVVLAVDSQVAKPVWREDAWKMVYGAEPIAILDVRSG